MSGIFKTVQHPNCSRCGATIELGRLDVLPNTKLCANCAYQDFGQSIHVPRDWERPTARKKRTRLTRQEQEWKDAGWVQSGNGCWIRSSAPKVPAAAINVVYDDSL